MESSTVGEEKEEKEGSFPHSTDLQGEKDSRAPSFKLVSGEGEKTKKTPTPRGTAFNTAEKIIGKNEKGLVLGRGMG